MTRALEEGA